MRVEVYVAQVEKTVAIERVMLRAVNRGSSMVDMTLVLRDGQDYGRYKVGDVINIDVSPAPVSSHATTF